MDNVVEIWNARSLKRGLRRHWVRMGDEIVITGNRFEPYGTLSICRQQASACLIATLTLGDRTFTETLLHRSELVVQIYDVELVVAVRVVEGARVLVELGTPRRNRAKVALLG